MIAGDITLISTICGDQKEWNGAVHTTKSWFLLLSAQYTQELHIYIQSYRSVPVQEVWEGCESEGVCVW